MDEEILFDVVHVYLIRAAGTDERVAEAARAAVDDPGFLDRVRDAVAVLLAADPATAPLVVRAGF
jgi:hypothetical protein